MDRRAPRPRAASGHAATRPHPRKRGDTWAAVHMARSRAFADYPGATPWPDSGTAPRRAPLLRTTRLTVEQILLWADAHRGRTNRCHAKLRPRRRPGALTWGAITTTWREACGACRAAVRWPSCCDRAPGRAEPGQPAPTTVGKSWSGRRHHARTGPGRARPPAGGRLGGQTWLAVDRRYAAAAAGCQALVPTPRLLAEARGVRNTSKLPGLTEDQILSWARRTSGARGPSLGGSTPDAGLGVQSPAAGLCSALERSRQPA